LPNSRSLPSLPALVVWAAVLCAAPALAEQPAAATLPTRAELADGTSEAAARLRFLEAQSLQNNPYANGARADKLERLVRLIDPDKRPQVRLHLGHESLLAGRTAAATAEFLYLSELLANAVIEIPAQTLREVHKLLAVSYLRQGEQENCIARHTSDSCLMPIRGSGVHRLQDGSRAAIGVLLAMLETDPGDLGSRWLLNLAYQTLGEYPEKVPPRWLIPPAAFASAAEMPRLPDVATVLGVDVVGLSGGAIIEDFDGDGYLDIVASSWGDADPLRFFRNQTDGSFRDVSAGAGLDGITGGLNLLHADYDNDGDPDILLLRGAWRGRNGAVPNSLLRNNGDGTFSDVTRSAGILRERPTQNAAWGDFNNDGWLDLFVGNESTEKAVYPSELWIANGDGTFRDGSAEAGLAFSAFVKGSAWGDYDNDGRLDLYVSVMYASNKLFHNEGPDAEGRWRFVERATQAGVTEPPASFPTWFFDYDNDGWQDIFVSGYNLDRSGQAAGDAAADYLGLPRRAERPRLYRNNGDGTFTDRAVEAGLDIGPYTMGCNFGDVDNDGFLDFYLGTGEPDLSGIVPNRMFRNDDGRRFLEVTTAAGVGHVQKGHGIAFGDLDNDGDQDIYAVMGGAHEGDVFQNALFENPTSGAHWVTLILEGVESNRSAIGARIKVTVREPKGTRAIYVTVSTGGSFGSSSLRQEIGLGRAESIESVEVTWPRSGRRQSFDAVPIDRIVRLVEGRAALSVVALERVTLKAPAEAAPAPHHVHTP